MTVPRGHRLFAKYAHAPNALGYCGPAGCGGTSRGRAGAGERRRRAVRWHAASRAPGPTSRCSPTSPGSTTRWTNAWFVATGRQRPHRRGRATSGSGRRCSSGSGHRPATTGAPDRRPAGRGCAHARVPRVRRLPVVAAAAAGLPEPLDVLDSCRIGWAKVAEVEAEHLLVRMAHLDYATASWRWVRPARSGSRIASMGRASSTRSGRGTTSPCTGASCATASPPTRSRGSSDGPPGSWTR